MALAGAVERHRIRPQRLCYIVYLPRLTAMVRKTAGSAPGAGGKAILYVLANFPDALPSVKRHFPATSCRFTATRFLLHQRGHGRVGGAKERSALPAGASQRESRECFPGTLSLYGGETLHRFSRRVVGRQGRFIVSRSERSSRTLPPDDREVAPPPRRGFPEIASRSCRHSRSGLVKAHHRRNITGRSPPSTSTWALVQCWQAFPPSAGSYLGSSSKTTRSHSNRSPRSISRFCASSKLRLSSSALTISSLPETTCASFSRA